MADKDNETKLKIFGIAIALFKEKGFDSVTIRDICAASSISKHTFYYYFASKDELLLSFRAIPESLHADYLQNILAAENYFEQYMLLTTRMTDFFISMGPEISKRIISLNVTCKTDSLEKIRHHRIKDVETDILRKAQTAGEIRNQSEVHALVGVSFGLLFSAVFHWSMGGGAFDLPAFARTAIENALDVRQDLRKGDNSITWMHQEPSPTP